MHGALMDGYDSEGGDGCCCCFGRLGTGDGCGDSAARCCCLELKLTFWMACVVCLRLVYWGLLITWDDRLRARNGGNKRFYCSTLDKMDV